MRRTLRGSHPASHIAVDHFVEYFVESITVPHAAVGAVRLDALVQTIES
jgi:hypothetical protein